MGECAEEELFEHEVNNIKGWMSPIDRLLCCDVIGASASAAGGAEFEVDSWQQHAGQT